MSTEPDAGILTAALDRIIPSVDELPGAGGLGIAQEVIDRSRPEPRFWHALEVVSEALSGSGDFISMEGGSQDETLRAIESEHPAEFGVWLDVVYTIYYMQPEVHRWLSWRGRPPQPEGNVMPPWDESILENIRRREPFWRKV